METAAVVVFAFDGLLPNHRASFRIRALLFLEIGVGFHYRDSHRLGLFMPHRVVYSTSINAVRVFGHSAVYTRRESWIHPFSTKDDVKCHFPLSLSYIDIEDKMLYGIVLSDIKIRYLSPSLDISVFHISTRSTREKWQFSRHSNTNCKFVKNMQIFLSKRDKMRFSIRAQKYFPIHFFLFLKSEFSQRPDVGIRGI